MNNFTIDPEILTLIANTAMKVVGVVVLLFVAAWVATRVRKMVFRSLETSRLDLTLAKFFSNAARYTVLVVAVVSVLGIFGIPTASFAAVLAAAGFAIGMAFQGTLSNFSAGIMLLVFRPFRVGQFIKVAGVSGTVAEIELFTTILDTADNRRLVVPNGSVFGATIENVSHHENRRVDITVGTDYSADLGRTREHLTKVAQELDLVLDEPPFQVVLSDLGASSVDWTIRLWTQSANYWPLREAALEATKSALDEAGIGIPFPQMDIHLTGQGPKETSPGKRESTQPTVM